MTLNNSVYYDNKTLTIDTVPISKIITEFGTPTYIYSERRIRNNFRQIQSVFSSINAHVHYSAKANANLSILRILHASGSGIDVVSGGELFRALQAGFHANQVVFAGVGKTESEIRYALQEGVGWFNVENINECAMIDRIAKKLGMRKVKVALRYNPQVQANTHPHIATGHGGAKFGLTGEAIQYILSSSNDYPNISLVGLHLHIGSQLGDANASEQAFRQAVDLIRPYREITTLNLGGGFPVAYYPDQEVPNREDFVQRIAPIVDGYNIIIEPGRSIIADAGILATEVLYTKQHGGQNFAIVDASMTELIRPALYQAHHEIVPITKASNAHQVTQVVGPVCETTDVFGRDVSLPAVQVGEKLAILTAGAYGMVMSSNYNARPRPAEVLVHPDGTLELIRRREAFEDLIAFEK